METLTPLMDAGGSDACVMLLYAAGELSPADRAAVDRAIAADPVAAAVAAEVAAAYAGALAAVEAADAADPIAPAAEAASLRRTSRAMRQWQVDRLTRPAAAGLAAGGRAGTDPQWWRRLPNWTYAAAVAAVLVTGAVAWWGVGPADPATGAAGTSTVAEGTADGDNSSNADSTAVATADADRLERSFAADLPDGLADAETQAKALPANNDVASTSSVFFGAAD